MVSPYSQTQVLKQISEELRGVAFERLNKWLALLGSSALASHITKNKNNMCC